MAEKTYQPLFGLFVRPRVTIPPCFTAFAGTRQPQVEHCKMERLAYSINETARTLSLGRTSIYAMIADKRLEAFKLGRRTLIRAESIRRLVAGEA